MSDLSVDLALGLTWSLALESSAVLALGLALEPQRWNLALGLALEQV
jgi:hypothetical protein